MGGSAFYEAIMDCAKEDGTDHLLTSVPGVWECVTEYYNNAAFERIGHVTEPVEPATPSFGG